MKISRLTPFSFTNSHINCTWFLRSVAHWKIGICYWISALKKESSSTPLLVPLIVSFSFVASVKRHFFRQLSFMGYLMLCNKPQNVVEKNNELTSWPVLLVWASLNWSFWGLSMCHGHLQVAWGLANLGWFHSHVWALAGYRLGHVSVNIQQASLGLSSPWSQSSEKEQKWACEVSWVSELVYCDFHCSLLVKMSQGQSRFKRRGNRRCLFRERNSKITLQGVWIQERAKNYVFPPIYCMYLALPMM